jgi:hypothetical protein
MNGIVCRRCTRSVRYRNCSDALRPGRERRQLSNRKVPDLIRPDVRRDGWFRGYNFPLLFLKPYCDFARQMSETPTQKTRLVTKSLRNVTPRTNAHFDVYIQS